MFPFEVWSLKIKTNRIDIIDDKRIEQKISFAWYSGNPLIQPTLDHKTVLVYSFSQNGGYPDYLGRLHESEAWRATQDNTAKLKERNDNMVLFSS